MRIYGDIYDMPRGRATSGLGSVAVMGTLNTSKRSDHLVIVRIWTLQLTQHDLMNRTDRILKGTACPLFVAVSGEENHTSRAFTSRIRVEVPTVSAVF